MKKVNIVVFFSFLIIVLFSACFYDNEEELFIQIDTTCDTTTVSYSGTIAPLLQANCLGCHGASADVSGGGINLQTYAQVQSKIDRIIGCVSQQSGFSPMPKNGSAFDACKVNQLKIWQRNGTPDN